MTICIDNYVSYKKGQRYLFTTANQGDNYQLSRLALSALYKLSSNGI